MATHFALNDSRRNCKAHQKVAQHSERTITFDPENRPEISGLLSTAAICTGRDATEIADEIGDGGAGQLKRYVTEVVNDYFAPIRARREEIAQDMDYVADVIHEAISKHAKLLQLPSNRSVKQWA